jgi:glycosyltransferase involved in cell wall biosynthesis
LSVAVGGDRRKPAAGAGRRPRLLFAARRPPFPLVNGSRIRTHRLLTGLAETFDTTFLTFDHHPDSPDGSLPVDELARLLPGIDVVTVPGCGPGKRLRQLGTLASTRSWEYGRYRRSRMASELQRLVDRRQPQVVHFDDLGVAQLGPLPGPVNVYASHNVEHRILASTVDHSRGLRRQFARVEQRKVWNVERRVWQAMALTLACSQFDAEQMRRGGARAIVCPNGADPTPVLPAPRRAPDEPFRVLFVGALNYRPNQLGLEWFIGGVLPLLRDRLPVPLVIDAVGTPPADPPSAQELVIHGRVPAVEPYYARAHAVIVPVLFGSGTRLKMVEAMVQRRPIVATAAGAEGLPTQSERDYFEHDDAAGFADALVRLCDWCGSGDPRLEALLASARTAVEPLLWPRIVADLSECYLAELAASGR